MGDPGAPPVQAGELLLLLDRHGVRYVLIGGLAATVHGATRVTFDIDLVPDWTRANLERLASALREAEAKLVAPEAPEPVAFPIDAHSLNQFEVPTWRTAYGDLDVVVGTPTTKRGVLASYRDLADRATKADAFGVTILVASLDDVIESKQALARESDLVALPELHRLRARRR
jgi:hypothetical protein